MLGWAKTVRWFAPVRGLWRCHGQSGVLARVRLTLLTITLVLALITTVQVGFGSGPLGWRLAAVGMMAGLACWWLTGLRRGRFPLIGEPFEVLVIPVLAVAAGGLAPVFGIFFFVLNFRSL